MSYIFCSLFCWIFGLFSSQSVRILHISAIWAYWLSYIANIFFSCQLPLALFVVFPRERFCFVSVFMATLINLYFFMSPGFWVIENLSPHPGQRYIHPCVLVLVWFQFSLVDPLSVWLIFYMLWSMNLILSFSKWLTSCPSTFSKKSIYLFLGYFIPQVWLAYSSPSSDYHTNLLQMLYSVF